MKPIWEYNASYTKDDQGISVEFIIPDDDVPLTIKHRRDEVMLMYAKIVAAYLLRGKGVSIEYISGLNISWVQGKDVVFKCEVPAAPPVDLYWRDVLRPLIERANAKYINPNDKV